MRGAKISKSKGNYVPLKQLRQFVPGEMIRGFLLTEDTLHRDGDFSTEVLLRRTSEMADVYGNLLMRSLGKAIASPVLSRADALEPMCVCGATKQRLEELVSEARADDK